MFTYNVSDINDKLEVLILENGITLSIGKEWRLTIPRTTLESNMNACEILRNYLGDLRAEIEASAVSVSVSEVE